MQTYAQNIYIKIFLIMKKNKLNILQVLPSLESGGVERGTLEIAKYLAKKKHNSYVISSGGRLEGDLIKNGSFHLKLNIGKKSLSSFFLIPKIINFIKQKKIDIIHVRSRFPAWIIFITLMFIPKKNKPFLVTSVHGYNSVSIYSSIMLRGDKVIVVSKALYEFLKSNYKLNAKNITIINRGVSKDLEVKRDINLRNFKNKFYRENEINKKSFLLLMPARVSRHKGIENFIKLINNLKNENFNVTGIISGDAKSSRYLCELKKIIKESKLEKNIIFTGYIKDIYKLMAISDISFSLSSLPEAFGRTVSESLKIKTPVIGFNLGGVGEQLKKFFPKGLIENNDDEMLFRRTKNFLVHKPRINKTNFYSL
jgi:glycosyltransferase involved in cell wall biosynthesis